LELSELGAELVESIAEMWSGADATRAGFGVGIREV